MSKIIIKVNGEDVEITLTTEQLASIEEQKKPKQFKFKYPYGYTLGYISLKWG